jgi:hypothetical protein
MQPLKSFIMNTILISGTYQSIGNMINYDVFIWASKEGEQIQFVTSKFLPLDNYTTLWALAKANVISYFGNDAKFDDGAYTQFLDHLTPVK